MSIVHNIDTFQQVVKMKACHSFQSNTSPSLADLEVGTGGSSLLYNGMHVDTYG